MFVWKNLFVTSYQQYLILDELKLNILLRSILQLTGLRQNK